MKKSKLLDTEPRAARFHQELLRRASLARRAQLALSLSDTVIGLSRRAIGRHHPGATKGEMGFLFGLAALRLGARREGAQVRSYLSPVSLPAILLALTPVVEAFESLGVRYYVSGSGASLGRGI